MEPHVLSLLKQIARREGLSSTFQSEIKGGVVQGSNFHGEITKVSLSDSGSSLKLIIKSAPTDETTRAIQKIENKFWNEHYFYSTVRCKLEDHGKLPSIPKYYGSSLEKYKEIIVLEDLDFKGYRNRQFSKAFDEEHLDLILKAFALFQSASFAWKLKNKSEFFQIGKLFRENLFLDHQDERTRKVLKIMLEGSASIGTNHARIHLDNDSVERMDTFSNNVYQSMLDWVDPDEGEPYTVLTHGDAWCNNFLFKYEKGKPVDVGLIDWQMTRLGSPLLDVAQCLFSSANEFCLQSLNRLFDQHMELIKLPSKDYGQHLIKYGQFGLMMAFAVLPFATAVEPINMEKVMAGILETSQFKYDLDETFSPRAAAIVKAACEINII